MMPRFTLGVEPQAALVRAERRVELNPEAAVHLHRAASSTHGTRNMICRSGSTSARTMPALEVLRMPLQHRCDRVEYLEHGLVELGLPGAAGDGPLVDGREGRGQCRVHWRYMEFSLDLGAEDAPSGHRRYS
jgi:hypothetical protein